MYIPRILKDILISFLSALLFLLGKGFIYNTADQIEPLVLVYKKLNSNLYVGDFYVESAQNIFTVRYYYVELLAFFGKYFSLYHISLVGTFLCLFFASWGLIKITRALVSDNLSGYATPFFVLFLFISWTVGGNEIQYNLLISSSLAKALSIWGIYFLLRKRWALSAILIGFGGTFQVLVGLQLGVIIIAYLIIHQQWKSILQWGAVWLMVISPMLIPILFIQFYSSTKDAVNEGEFYHLLYYFRNPYHYLPNLFPLTSYIKLVILLVIGNISLFVFLRRKLFYKLMIINVIIILGLIVYSVLILNFQVMSIGKIQWFKTTIVLSAIAAIGVSIAFEYTAKRFSLYRYFFGVGILLPIIYIAYAQFRYDFPVGLDHRSENQKELADVHEWIKENTPVEAIFATYIDDEGFLCEAQRPLTIALNPIVHEPWFMVKWYDRMYQQYQVDSTETDHIKMKLEANQYYETGEWIPETSAEYCVFRKNVDLEGLESIHESRNYKVLKINR
ncbi:MAG TPA: DUF6798 domain-containing protein [Chitinophagales bacterium]|nr:DUF6798 domain-containing protein [Chitinophagales bacterium]